MAISRRQIISSGKQATSNTGGLCHEEDSAPGGRPRQQQQQQQEGKMLARRALKSIQSSGVKADETSSRARSRAASQTTMNHHLASNYVKGGGVHNNNNNNNSSSSLQPNDSSQANAHLLSRHQLAESSDGYVVADQSQSSSSNQTYEEYYEGEQEAQDYRHFDPYSIYSEEEDVWYSEERIFEDHLDEIHNKWSLLDDDIWCKLIIMERNRRIGKAYARVPLVTIDGSHELSYDGYKLALNGFDNPDRDSESEECRKRIGKGIRIKMDDFGNILIKRLSKSGVYVKEWLNTSTSSGSSNSTNGSSGAGVGRPMPSRQQVIKNSESGVVGAQQQQQQQQQQHLEPANDSALCDEVLSVRGRLELDKIYVLFDMNKFQANLSQEMCRLYPSRRKLEQQCFSIVGLARDSEDVLNLPCWVMVINIVALELLYGKLPMTNRIRPSVGPTTMSSRSNRAHLDDYATSTQSTKMMAPSFLSVFEHPNNNGQRRRAVQNGHDEDPYSLPANASSSDVKSSINDYGTNLISSSSSSNINNNKNISNKSVYGDELAPPLRQRRMFAGARRATGAAVQNKYQHELAKQRSKSNCNIYGHNTSAARFNSSIYSPGHMLVQPAGGEQQVPPKLPPRDFVVKKSRSSSSNNLASSLNGAGGGGGGPDNQTAPASEMEIYSSGAPAAARKPKKSRFLESLRAPLELARSSRSASALGAPAMTAPAPIAAGLGAHKAPNTSKGVARNLKSLLGVGGKQTSKQTQLDDPYARLDISAAGRRDKSRPATAGSTLLSRNSAEADSVVDSNEELDDSQHQIVPAAAAAAAATKDSSDSSAAASYNDLDIPTPDYESDENIYAHQQQHQDNAAATNGKPSRARRFSSSYKELLQLESAQVNTKDDLYYSGFLAHVPHRSAYGQQSHHGATNDATNSAISLGGGQSRRLHARSASTHLFGAPMFAGDQLGAGGQRFLGRAGRPSIGRASDQQQQQLIYGSALGLPPSSVINSRYRSVSMQRYCSSSSSAAAARLCQQTAGLEPNGCGQLGCDIGPDTQVCTSKRAPRARRLAKKSLAAGHQSNGIQQQQQQQQQQHELPVLAGGHYDLDRSSSGIYGNNSSSSSDYADWHPQERKVNSSGYLNCIFKTGTMPAGCHQQRRQEEHDSRTNPANNNNNNNGNCNNINNINNSAAKSLAGRNSNNYTTAANSKTLKCAPAKSAGAGKQMQAPLNGAAYTAAPGSKLTSATPQTKATNKKQQEQMNGNANGTGTSGNTAKYRSYDSSNDSDPSYTNSSDGLDIYDHIGGATRAQADANNCIEQEHHKQRRHKQFLEQPVHVGEWEDMYDR